MAPRVAALQALLDADPLLVLPSRIPKLPSFFVAASFRRPELRRSGAALPAGDGAHRHDARDQQTRSAVRGPGHRARSLHGRIVGRVRLGLFEAWAAGGSPSKENWAFSRWVCWATTRLHAGCAKIREWPGESSTSAR